MKRGLDWCHQKVAELKKYKFLIRPFLIVFVIYLLCFSAIFRANYNYIDDMGRVSTGDSGWENFSRHTSNFLSRFVHTSSFLADASPLPQIIAIAILGFSSVLLVYLISGKKKTFSIWQLLASMIIGISPYYLECLSYKYDAPYMALSVLAMIIPFIFYKTNWKAFGVSAIVGTLITCTTYQVSLSVFLILLIFFVMQDLLNKVRLKTILINAGAGIGGLLIGLLIFKIFLLKPVDAYVSSNFADITNLLPTFASNLKNYLTLLKSDFGRTLWRILIAVVGILFIVFAVKKSKINKLLSAVVIVVSCGLMFIGSFGLYLFLENPLFETRAMYGVGIFIAVLAIYIASHGFAIGKIVSTALVWCFIVFAFVYGNVLYSQTQYINYRSTDLIAGMNSIETFSTDEQKIMEISGTIDYAPSIRNTIYAYRGILDRLVPNVLRSPGWTWSDYSLFTYYDMKNVDRGVIPDEYRDKLVVVKNSMNYTIKQYENYILVELH